MDDYLKAARKGAKATVPPASTHRSSNGALSRKRQAGTSGSTPRSSDGSSTNKRQGRAIVSSKSSSKEPKETSKKRKAAASQTKEQSKSSSKEPKETSKKRKAAASQTKSKSQKTNKKSNSKPAKKHEPNEKKKQSVVGTKEPPKKVQGTLNVYSMKDVLKEDPKQKDCQDVLGWQKLDIGPKPVDLEERLTEAAKLRSEADVLAKKKQYRQGQALEDRAKAIVEMVAGRKEKIVICRSVEIKAKRCYDAHFAERNYIHAEEWEKILFAARLLQGKDEDGNYPTTANKDSTVKNGDNLTKQSTTKTSNNSSKQSEPVKNGTSSGEAGKKSAAAGKVVVDLVDRAEDEAAKEEEVAVIELKDGTKKAVDQVFKPAPLHKQGEAKKSMRSCYGKKLAPHKQGSAKEKSWKIDQKRFKKIINAKWGPRTRVIKGKKVIFGGENKLKEGLRLDPPDAPEGILFCDPCLKPVNPEEVPQHIATAAHISARQELEAKNVHKQATIPLLNNELEKRQSKGQGLLGRVKYHRYRTFGNLCSSNITVSSYFDGMSDYVDEGHGLSCGAAADLADVYAPIYRNQLVTGIQALLDNCYPEFATITDECASFAKCFGMKIVKVTKDYRIINPLVEFALHDKALNGENTANRMLTSILQNAGEDPNAWVFAGYDGASTNECSINAVKDITMYAPSGRICVGHTLCRCGEKPKTPHLTKFRNKFNIAMRYTGKLTDRFKSVFGEAPIKSNSIRFWVWFEQYAQFVDFGLEKIMTIIQWGIDNDASKVSCESFVALFGSHTEGFVSLAMATLEAAAIVDRLKLIVQCTYMSEATPVHPIMLGAEVMFEDLDRAATSLEFEMTHVQRLAPAINQLLSQAQQSFTNAIDKAEKELLDATQAHVTLADELKSVQESVVGRSRSGRTVSRRNYNNPGEEQDRQVEAQQRVSTLTDSVKKASDEMILKQGLLQTKKDALAKWKEGQHLPGMDFIAYAKSMTDPAWHHYRKQFMHVEGKCYKTRECSRAARIFDPFFLEVTSIDALKLLVDKFKHFELAQFDADFLQGLKNELVIAKEHAMLPFDWEGVPESKLYKNRSQGRKLRKERAAVRGDVAEGDGEQSDALGSRSEIVEFQSWKKDPAERGRRIFEWWRVRIYEVGEGSTDFHYFAKALRLVALLPLTSCDLERSFSIWVAITHACGKQMRKDVIESRMLTRGNKSLVNEILKCAGDPDLSKVVLEDVDDFKDGVEEDVEVEQVAGDEQPAVGAGDVEDEEVADGSEASEEDGDGDLYKDEDESIEPMPPLPEPDVEMEAL